jgi:hypothetical protein
MSEQSNFSNHSRRLFGVILLSIGVCLLAAQFLVTVMPGTVQKNIATQATKDDFATIGDTVDEKIETVVAQEVATTQAADAGANQELAVEVEIEPDIAVEPIFAVKPVFGFKQGTLIQFNLQSAFRIVDSLIAFIFLGVGYYILNTRNEPNKME